MKNNNFLLSITMAGLLSAMTVFSQTNTTGTNWVVTITAPDASASEAGDPGLFIVSRGTNTLGNLPVFLLISGTALNGTDYQAISNRVLIADGETSITVAVAPLDDSTPEPTESVTVRIILPLTGFFPYRIGSPNTATVNITDDDGFVPSNQPPVVNIVQPTNGAAFVAPANIAIRASAQDFDGSVASVEFFAGNQSLGFGNHADPNGTIGNLYSLTWSNVPPGAYDLTAKATDDDGAMRISAVVHIFVGTNQPPPPTNQPPLVNIVQPTNGAFFLAQANISIRAFAQDFDGFVASVEFFANNHSLGFGRSTNSAGVVNSLFLLTWSNVPPGAYDLTAKATDDDGAMRTSPVVHIFVGTNQPPPPTNQLPIVTIIASDPTASEGLAMWCSNTVAGVNWLCVTNGILRTNWPCPTGTNTATFTVRRSGSTNSPLRVYYSIGGSASNGVDYSALPGVVTIPAGARAAHIVVTPVDDNLREGIETVVLRLIPSHDPQANVPYIIGQPAIAAAYITDNDCAPPPCVRLADGTVHLCWPLTNQCFRVELSTNLVHWEGICTNRLADGAAHHLDPNAANNLLQFIRFIPVPCPEDE